MNIILNRPYYNAEETLGMLFLNAHLSAFTLEDQPQENKVMAETRIPAGVYQLQLRRFGTHHERYKEKFPGIHKGMIEIMNVPGFTDVLIHIGNTDKDTAGCVLVGTGVRLYDGRLKLEDSQLAYLSIYPKIAAAIESSPGGVFLTVADSI